jgi:hypothetical protein
MGNGNKVKKYHDILGEKNGLHLMFKKLYTSKR